MRFSIRRSVYFDDFDNWLSGLGGIPIELALPYTLDDFLAGMDRWLSLPSVIGAQRVLAVSCCVEFLRYLKAQDACHALKLLESFSDILQDRRWKFKTFYPAKEGTLS